MRYLICILLLAACATSRTSEEYFAQKCSQAGYVGTEHSDCVNAALEAAFKNTLAEQEAYSKQRKDADISKCKSFGIKPKTKEFSNCLMAQEKERKEDQRHFQTMRAETEYREQQRRADAVRDFQQLQRDLRDAAPVHCRTSYGTTTCY